VKWFTVTLDFSGSHGKWALTSRPISDSNVPDFARRQLTDDTLVLEEGLTADDVEGWDSITPFDTTIQSSFCNKTESAIPS